MISNPIEVSPNNISLDASLDFVVSMKMQASGDKIKKIVYSFFDPSGHWNSTASKSNLELYNNDVVTLTHRFTNHSNTTVYWQAQLYSENCNNFTRNLYVRVITSNTLSIDKDTSIATVLGDLKYELEFQGARKQVTNITHATDYTVFTFDSAFADPPAVNENVYLYTNTIKTETYNFFASYTPTISLDISAGTVITDFSHEFICTYIQSEGIMPKYYVFNLYNEREELIQTSGTIYSGRIKYTIDNLLNGSYRIEAIVVNQKNITVSTSVQFTVNINTAQLTYTLNLSFDEDESCAKIKWPSYKSLKGAVEPSSTNLTYVNNSYNTKKSVSIPANALVKYNNSNNIALQIDKNSVILYGGTIKSYGDILTFKFKHDYFPSGTGNGIFKIVLNNSRFTARVEFSDKNGQNTHIKEKVIKNFFSSDTSCFSSSLIPTQNRLQNYILYNDAIWDTSKYFIANLSSDIDDLRQHYKINIIPTFALDYVVNDNTIDTGIYIENVTDLDPLLSGGE